MIPPYIGIYISTLYVQLFTNKQLSQQYKIELKTNPYIHDFL